MPSNAVSVLASSVGTAATVALDWMRGGNTTVRLTSPSTTASAATGGVLQVTVDDLVRTPAASVIWSGLSTQGTVSTGTGTVLTASTIIDGQLWYQFTTPLAGIRFSCSGFSSGGVRMVVLQQY